VLALLLLPELVAEELEPGVVMVDCWLADSDGWVIG